LHFEVGNTWLLTVKKTIQWANLVAGSKSLCINQAFFFKFVKFHTLKVKQPVSELEGVKVMPTYGV